MASKMLLGARNVPKEKGLCVSPIDEAWSNATFHVKCSKICMKLKSPCGGDSAIELSSIFCRKGLEAIDQLGSIDVAKQPSDPLDSVKRTRAVFEGEFLSSRERAYLRRAPIGPIG